MALFNIYFAHGSIVSKKLFLHKSPLARISAQEEEAFGRRATVVIAERKRLFSAILDVSSHL